MTTSDTVRSTVTNDGVVLLDVSSGKIFNSNAVGSRIWVKLQDGLDIDTITAQLGCEFDVAPERLRADVREFIDKLMQNGIVTDPAGQ